LTSDNNLSPILRRLDEIERKLDDVLEELRTPAAIGYSVRRRRIGKRLFAEVIGPRKRSAKLGRM